MAGLFGAYTSLLARRPMFGNIITASALFATGDVIAQQFVEKKGKDHDYTRTGRIVLWGGGIYAPIVTKWFGVLQKINFQSKLVTTGVRVGLDQFGMAPTILTGKGMDEVKKKWQADFIPTLQTNWAVWIPFQAVNLGIIPPHLRVLAVNAVNVPWNTFLSLQAAKGKGEAVKVEVGDTATTKVEKEASLR